MARERAWALVVVAALLAAGCAGKTAPRSADQGKLVLSCPVADAEVWVDGQFLGQVRSVRGGILLTPGTHLVKIRHDHYHTDYSKVDLSAGKRVVVRVYLAEKLL
ncbi:MAG TPA: carboxypeptidase-like regulatory domain-containing protein [Kofleriaceae bacterium]|nr:carboxypeptidase-like regulatory domain-containing protein [Kofleriaceae bacterium]